MNTGSIRARVILTTLSLFAFVLVAVVAATTLLYRANLDRDLHHRLASAATAMQRAWPNGGKQLLGGLALAGIAADIRAGPGPLPPAKAAAAGLAPVKPGTSMSTHGRSSS